MGRDRKNEKSGGKFVMLPNRVMDHPAWIGLSNSAKVVLLRIGRRWNGHNNGKIYAPTRAVGREVGLSRNTVGKALCELKAAGFIVETSPYHLGLEGKGRASQWRLTYFKADKGDPTYDYEKKQNPGTKTVPPMPKNRAKGNGSEKVEIPKVAQKPCQASEEEWHKNRANLRIYHGGTPKGRAHLGKVHRSAGATGKVLEGPEFLKPERHHQSESAML